MFAELPVPCGSNHQQGFLGTTLLGFANFLRATVWVGEAFLGGNSICSFINPVHSTPLTNSQAVLYLTRPADFQSHPLLDISVSVCGLEMFL